MFITIDTIQLQDVKSAVSFPVDLGASLITKQILVHCRSWSGQPL